MSKATRRKQPRAQTQSWRDFNHETRLALHTLQASLQMVKHDATPAQMHQLRIADRCSAAILQLLTNYAGADHGQQAAPTISQCGPMTCAIGHAVPPADDLALPPIGVNEFEKFDQLMQTGQLLKLEEWADELGEVFPALADVAHVIGFYASSADLPSLQTVLDRWRCQPG